MSETNDRDAIALLRRRDPRGFDLAYAAYAPQLFAFLRRLSGHRELAEDLLQHTFLRLAQHGPDLRPDSDLRAWLYSVARNGYWSIARRHVPHVDHEEILEHAAPATELEARLLLRDVERALTELCAEDREVLLLSFVDALQPDELAALLGLKPEALRKRLSRARARLFATLEQQRRKCND